MPLLSSMGEVGVSCPLRMSAYARERLLTTWQVHGVHVWYLSNASCAARARKGGERGYVAQTILKFMPPPCPQLEDEYAV
jgi:hypothetical protein